MFASIEAVCKSSGHKIVEQKSLDGVSSVFIAVRLTDLDVSSHRFGGKRQKRGRPACHFGTFSVEPLSAVLTESCGGTLLLVTVTVPFSDPCDYERSLHLLKAPRHVD